MKDTYVKLLNFISSGSNIFLNFGQNIKLAFFPKKNFVHSFGNLMINLKIFIDIISFSPENK